MKYLTQFKLIKGKCSATVVEASPNVSDNKSIENISDVKTENAIEPSKINIINKKSSENTLASKEPEIVMTTPPSPGNNNGTTVPLYKRRGMSETPEIQRKSRKLFPRYRSNPDSEAQKRALTAPPQSTSTTSSPACSPPSSTGGMSTGASISNRRSSSAGSGHEGSGSSRKSSISSGAKKAGGGKKFAVTLLVNEADKNKIVDMLHRAKQVISKKVEKVMGKTPKSTQRSSISNAEALTTVLQNWVEVEEKKEKKEETEMERLIEEQQLQATKMRQRGIEPPITIVTPPPESFKDGSKQYHFRSPSVPTLTVGSYSNFGSFPSPVPEETEDEDNEADDEREHDDDFEVQEVKEGEDNLLRLPNSRRFRLSRSITPQSPTRSLSPCDTVPRFFSRPESELYPANLRRPSSHFDYNAQVASSRPISPGHSTNLNQSPITVPSLNKSNRASPLAAENKPVSKESNVGKKSKFASINNQIVDEAQTTLLKTSGSEDKIVEDKIGEDEYKREKSEEIRFDFDRDIPISSWQRPESMTIPIGGVWHPGQSDDEDEFMKNLSGVPAGAIRRQSVKSPTPMKESREIIEIDWHFCVHLLLLFSNFIQAGSSKLITTTNDTNTLFTT